MKRLIRDGVVVGRLYESGYPLLRSSEFDEEGRTLLSVICRMLKEERGIRTLKSMDRFMSDFRGVDRDGTPPVLHALRLSHWRLADMMFKRMTLAKVWPHVGDEQRLKRRNRVRLENLIRPPLRIAKWARDEIAQRVIASGHAGLITCAFTLGGLDPRELYNGRNLIHHLCGLTHPFDRICLVIERFLWLVYQWPFYDEEGDGDPDWEEKALITGVPLKDHSADGLSAMEILLDRMRVNPVHGEEIFTMLLEHYPRKDRYGEELTRVREMASRYEFDRVVRLIDRYQDDIWAEDPSVLERLMDMSFPHMYLEGENIAALYWTLNHCDPPHQDRLYHQLCRIDKEVELDIESIEASERSR